MGSSESGVFVAIEKIRRYRVKQAEDEECMTGSDIDSTRHKILTTFSTIARGVWFPGYA